MLKSKYGKGLIKSDMDAIDNVLLKCYEESDNDCSLFCELALDELQSNKYSRAVVDNARKKSSWLMSYIYDFFNYKNLQ